MRRAILAQSFGVPFHWALTAGGVATLYVERFGAKDLMTGIINGSLWAGFASILFVPGLIDRYNKRAVLVTSILTATLVSVPLVFLPQIAGVITNHGAMIVMAALFVVYSACLSSYGAAWFPALMDFLPLQETVSFFARLRESWQVVSLFIYLLCSLALGPEVPISRFQMILVILIFGSAVRVYLVSTFPQRRIKSPASANTLGRVRQVLADMDFRRFACVNAAIAALTASIFPSMVLFMRLCGYSARGIMIAVAAGMAGTAVSYRLWNRLSDRRGLDAVYRTGLWMVAASFALWLPVSIAAWALQTPNLAYGIAIVALTLYSSGGAGLGLALTQHSFQLTPRHKATTYLSLLPAFSQAAMSLATVLVGSVFQLCRAHESRTWLNPYVIGFMVCGVLIIGIHPLVRRIPHAAVENEIQI